MQGWREGNGGAGREGESDVLSQKETLDLIAAWYKIKDTTTRQKTLELIKSLGA